MVDLIPAAQWVSATSWRQGMKTAQRLLPEEIAVALTYDRVTFAVMVASPADLEDFAVGFSLSEGIVETPQEIVSVEVLHRPDGAECRMALSPARRDAMAQRRRRLAGPVGCGLCGIESLAEAVKQPKAVGRGMRLDALELARAMRRLPDLQLLNQKTRGVHAAAFVIPGRDVFIVREDIGRHNALDKLIGRVAREGFAGADGVLLLTSRVSIELVQKAAAFGTEIMVAVSVPSARAVRDAAAAGLTLIGIARSDGFEIFTHPERITEACAPDRSAG